MQVLKIDKRGLEGQAWTGVILRPPASWKCRMSPSRKDQAWPGKCKRHIWAQWEKTACSREWDTECDPKSRSLWWPCSESSEGASSSWLSLSYSRTVLCCSYPLNNARMVGLVFGTLPALNLPGSCSTPMTLPGVMTKTHSSSSGRPCALLSQSLPSAQSRLSLYLYTLSSTTASPRCEVTASMKPAVRGPRSLFCLLWDLNQ